MFLPTLAAYFLGQKELFKGLYLEKAKEKHAVQEGRAAWEEYPVLYLDFNTGHDELSGALDESLRYLRYYTERAGSKLLARNTDLAGRQQLDYSQAVAALKQWYGEYRFYPKEEEVYNPFSLLNAFDNKEIKSY